MAFKEALLYTKPRVEGATQPRPGDAAHSISPMSALAFAGITFTVLAAQIVLSRLFAGILTYYYAFMLVSLAMLGLAAGALLVQIAPSTFRRERLGLQASILSMAMGAAAFGGVLAVLAIYPSVTHTTPGAYTLEFGPLAAIFFSIFPFFLFAGIIVSLVLGHGRKHFARLYAIDLVSAACGCVLAVVLMGIITPVETTLKVLAVIPFVSAALFALSERRTAVSLCALASAILCLCFGTWLSNRPEIARPPHVSFLRTKTIVNEWNAFSSVRVYPSRFFSWCLSSAYHGPTFPMLFLVIDGTGGTPVVQFDGNPQSLQRYEYLEYDLTALGQDLVPISGRQLIIGPGGGFDVLQSVRRGRSDVSLVEINPLVSRIMNEDLANFSGSPYKLKGVRLHIDNGRTYVKRSKERWNLITLTEVDTGGSAHALALSENYLYTVDAYKEYLEHLEPDGILSFTRSLPFQGTLRIDSLRGISIAVEALREMGVQDPGGHMIVAASTSPFFVNWPMCQVLVKKSPFTQEEIQRARAFLQKLGFQAVWLPDGSGGAGVMPEEVSTVVPLIRDIITTADPEKLYRESRFDIIPTTDDKPFYFVEHAGKNRSAGPGIQELNFCLAIQGMLVIPFLFLPLIPRWKNLAQLGAAGVTALAYFSFLGAAFMLVEIEFFNVFALVLGKPTITLAIVLSSLLVFSGTGSLVGGRRTGQAGTSGVVGAFAGLTGCLFFFLLLKQPILSYLVGLPSTGRIAGTILCIAPIAFFMGIPMPAGMTAIESRTDLVPWGWALNGAFSVFASTAGLYLAMNIGIARTFGFGVVFYIAAACLLVYLRKQQRHPEHKEASMVQ